MRQNISETKISRSMVCSPVETLASCVCQDLETRGILTFSPLGFRWMTEHISKYHSLPLPSVVKVTASSLLCVHSKHAK